MTATSFSDPSEFAGVVTPTLEEFEAENNLPLGIIATLVIARAPNPDALLAVIHSGPTITTESIVAVVMRTPPFPVVVAYTPRAADAAAADELVRLLHEKYVDDIVGFNADGRAIAPYVDAWARSTGSRPVVYMRTRVYRCAVVRPPARVAGSIRLPDAGDREVLRRFVTGFYHDALPDEYDPAKVDEFVERSLSSDRSSRGVVFWEVDGVPVSMAGYAGPTPHGIRVSAVYTPSEQRGRGYASACVAALTQTLLDEGRDFCFLFTDLSNPTSNSIYQAIGYEPVADWVNWRFISEA